MEHITIDANKEKVLYYGKRSCGSFKNCSLKGSFETQNGSSIDIWTPTTLYIIFQKVPEVTSHMQLWMEHSILKQ